jgi:hypothetical protein
MAHSFDIWCEGFNATGERGDATQLGTAVGTSFEDACARFFESHPEKSVYFNARDLTYWGCRLFDNEAAARKAYG